MFGHRERATDLCNKSRSCWNKSGSSMNPWACYNCTCRKWVGENSFPDMVLVPVPLFETVSGWALQSKTDQSLPKSTVVNPWNWSLDSSPQWQSLGSWQAREEKVKGNVQCCACSSAIPQAWWDHQELKNCSLPLGAEAELPFLKEQERLGIFAASNGSSLMLMICSVAIVWAFNK